MRSADKRNSAIRATPVTTFGYFQESIWKGRSLDESFSLAKGRRTDSQGTDNGTEVPGPVPSVHLGNQFRQAVRIALGQTAENYQFPGTAGLFPAGTFQDSVHRLFFSIPDKAAGVDQQIVDRGIHPFRNNLEIVPDLRQQVLGVHCVLGTAQRYDLKSPQSLFVSLVLSRFLGFSFFAKVKGGIGLEVIVPVHDFFHMRNVEPAVIIIRHSLLEKGLDILDGSLG